MRKAMMIITQVLIFIGAYFTMTPDVMEDNTYMFGLIGDVEVVKGNGIWVMSIAAVLSVLNILIWWPKAQGVVNTSSESSPAESTKSAKVEETNDPIVPKMD